MTKDKCISNTIWYCPFKEKNGKTCIVIYGFYVHPKMRGRGIGRKLLEVALSEIKQKYPGRSIKAEIKPFGKGGLNYKQLKKLYSEYRIKILKRRNHGKQTQGN